MFLGLATVFASRVCTDSWKKLFNVELLDLVVDIDIIGVQDLGVIERLQDWFLDSFGEEGVFVG